MPKLMSIRDFQDKYSLSRSTVYRLQKQGHIRFLHVGRAVRISVDDAEKWFASLEATTANDE